MPKQVERMEIAREGTEAELKKKKKKGVGKRHYSILKIYVGFRLM